MPRHWLTSGQMVTCEYCKIVSEFWQKTSRSCQQKQHLLPGFYTSVHLKRRSTLAVQNLSSSQSPAGKSHPCACVCAITVSPLWEVACMLHTFTPTIQWEDEGVLQSRGVLAMGPLSLPAPRNGCSQTRWKTADLDSDLQSVYGYLCTSALFDAFSFLLPLWIAWGLIFIPNHEVLLLTKFL